MFYSKNLLLKYPILLLAKLPLVCTENLISIFWKIDMYYIYFYYTFKHNTLLNIVFHVHP